MARQLREGRENSLDEDVKISGANQESKASEKRDAFDVAKFRQ